MNQFAVAPRIVAESDLIAVLPTRIVQFSRFVDQLHSTTLPLELMPSTLKMMWHERNQLEGGQQWLRSQLIEICQQFG